MKVLILRHTDQPAVNICKNIAKYSKHDCTIVNRDHRDLSGFDVIFYYNSNDLVFDNRKRFYKELKNSSHKISVGIQSQRVIDFGLIPRIASLDNIVGICTPTLSNMEEVQEALAHKDLIYEVTPFSADTGLFKCTNAIDINSTDKLNVGYIGSWTPNKRFKAVVMPALEILKDEVTPFLYGQVGKRVPHDKMYKEYNKMDCLLISSLVTETRANETGPMPVLEAALCGRTSITTRCGQIPSLFDSTQVLFYNGTTEELVHSIRKFIKDRKLCKEMGENARKQMLLENSWESLIKTQDRFFERVYERIYGEVF